MVGDMRQRPVQVPANIVMHAYPVRPCIGKSGDKLVRILDHQVAVERQLRRLAQARHHRRSDRDIGHEMPVHDVDVDHRTAATLRRGNLVRKVRKICRQDRWKQLNHACLKHPFVPGQFITGTYP